jgi:hypothetical protein
MQRLKRNAKAQNRKERRKVFWFYKKTVFGFLGVFPGFPLRLALERLLLVSERSERVFKMFLSTRESK